MKTLKFLAFLLLFTLVLKSQSSNNLYGIVRQNYSSWVEDPSIPGDSFEVFDSATIRLASMDPLTGFVDNIGSYKMNGTVNLTGAALNPYDSTFIFLGFRDIISLDLKTGNIANRALVYNPLADSYFDNFRFNNADSSLYGLARTNYYSWMIDPVFPMDSIQVLDSSTLHLATVDPSTGLISLVSSSSIGMGFALAGSAIDPYQMVYYYSTGSNLVGLDIYDGSIYSNVSIINPYGVVFDNFAYSCADTSIYGLVRQNYFSWYTDPSFPLDSFEILDSSTVRLGKIDANTGIVSIVSPSTISYGGYSLNAGAAVDPNTMTYYYGTGYSLVGVSLITGNKVSETPYDFEEGQYFDLMRNFQNCKSAVASRIKGEATKLETITSHSEINIYPNPTTNQFQIKSNTGIQNVSIVDISGKTILNEKFDDSRNETTITVSNYSSGMYFVTVNENNHSKLFIK